MFLRAFGLLLIVNLFCNTVFAQTLRLGGKVTNNKNEALSGVTIKIGGSTAGTMSDLDGRFSLSLVTGKKYSLEFSAVGYTTKTISDVEVSAGVENELNVILEVKAKTEEAVVVTARTSTARRESVNSMISFQRNTNTVASVIAAEAIRRSPDRNTGEVLKRTPGASIQEGKFIVIRGLADRYNQAMINGILLTSTEPDRKTFSFDIIPSNIIDNLVINKAFVPEYPGEWAGGLIQVNTKDIPSKSFFQLQVGSGFNSQTLGNTFYKDQSSSTDWLGFDNGSRALPSSYVRKAAFDTLSPAEKTAIGKQLRNAWTPIATNVQPNLSLQLNGGVSTKLFGKTLGATLGISYNRSFRLLKLLNRSNSLSGNTFSVNYSYEDTRYVQDINVGAIAGLSLQLNSMNRISFKSILSLNSPTSVTVRNGEDFNRAEQLKANELQFKQNTFYTSQLNGDHSFSSTIKFKWYGSFNILDGYIPDQRRIAYVKTSGSQNPYRLLLSNTLSQQSGSRIYQSLSDYIYTAGGDLSFGFNAFGQKQTLKTGYMIQVKDRLYDAQLFANFLPRDNAALTLLPAETVFSPANFGNGLDNKIGFDAIKGKTFRYMANTILNAGFVQFDNQLSDKIRLVWGVRAEHFDQLVGSVKTWDPRHSYTKVLDFLPGLNTTIKVNSKTNLRISGSQTVIRPELRELSFLNIYDFELNASVQGNPSLKRTKVSNFDVRYEVYPKAGEVLTAGIFYKNFKNPIEQLFNEGSGGASTFSYQNPDQATAYGFEFEMRKKLDFSTALKNFTFQANASYIKSSVKDAGFQIDRPMQGQSPYLINIGLLYDLEKAGLSSTLLFNQIGERIYLVGDLTSGAGSPDIWEAPRPLLDFQLTKKIMKKKAEVRLNISDLLNATQYFYQNVDKNVRLQKGVDAYRFTRKPGTNYQLAFQFSL
ncbi:MAG: TonB-dependent receptor [Chitinophagaceae bacterium]|nr:TonB-dependent receptor [Chitinophagia bacterium]NDB52672.1 TonB-dependent receptor [Chitinophagaceae bacterium]